MSRRSTYTTNTAKPQSVSQEKIKKHAHGRIACVCAYDVHLIEPRNAHTKQDLVHYVTCTQQAIHQTMSITVRVHRSRGKGSMYQYTTSDRSQT